MRDNRHPARDNNRTRSFTGVRPAGNIVRLLGGLTLLSLAARGLAADEISALRMEAEKRVGISVSVPSARDLPEPHRSDVTFEPLRVVESRGGDAQAAALYLRVYMDEF